MPDFSRRGRGLALLQEAQNRAEKAKEVNPEKVERVENKSSDDIIVPESVSGEQNSNSEKKIKRKRGRKPKEEDNDFRPYLRSSVKGDLDIIRLVLNIENKNMGASYSDAIDFLFDFYWKRELKKKLSKIIDVD